MFKSYKEKFKENFGLSKTSFDSDLYSLKQLYHKIKSEDKSDLLAKRLEKEVKKLKDQYEKDYHLFYEVDR